MLKMQALLVELLVNPAAYRAFVADPDGFAPGLDDNARAKLRRFNAEELATFRGIVAGTRALRFAEILPRLRRHLGDAWRAYITRFFDSVAIRDSSHENDTRLFVELVERECADPRIVQCARLELALLLLSNEGAAKACGGVIELALDYELGSLLSDDLENIQPALAARFRFTRNAETHQIDFDVV